MHKIKSIALCAMAALAFIAWAPPALAATLSFSAPAEVVAGEVFSLNVLIDSKDRGFNAAEATILFPNDLLEVVSVDIVPSSTGFNFWLSAPSFSNEKGVVSFSGGTTRGVISSSARILSFHMKARGSGEALITASDASINASDGSGSNILDLIQSLRITVSKAPIIISAPSMPVPKPQVQVASVSATTTLEDERCGGLFADCELRYPAINFTSVQLHSQVGADLHISGTAPDGAHVHLRLSRDGVPYKEITAIIQEDRTWEGVLSNIYAYGTYTLSAWAENADSTQKSSVVESDPIDIYPPFTLHPFGYVLRWYALATAAFGVLVGILVALLLWRYAVRRKQYYTDATVIACAVASVAFVGMFITAYILWQKEYRSIDTFWKDTDIPCILRAPSYIDVFDSVKLSIYVDSTLQPIPTEIGFSPKCVAQIHTHDETGRLHIQRTGRAMTLPDFFTVAGIPFEQKDHTMSVTVNGKDYTDTADTYALQNGDAIKVIYTSVSAKTR